MWIQTDFGSWLNLQQQKGVQVSQDVVCTGDGREGGTIISRHDSTEEAQARLKDIMAQMESGAAFYKAQ